MGRNIVVMWTLRIVLAAGFLIPAVTKMIGDENWNTEFETIGFGFWFLYFVAAVEIAAAILLLHPATTPFGVVLSLCIVTGALLAQLMYFMNFPHIAVYMVLLVILLYMTRDRLKIPGTEATST